MNNLMNSYKNFFTETWPLLLSKASSLELSTYESPKDLAEKLYADVVPSLDDFIYKYDLPFLKTEGETDDSFFQRLVGHMYNLNEQNSSHKGWRDCWPSTAIEIGRVNCALGSLVLARVLEKAGYDGVDIRYGFPGPLTHAVIVVKERYLDQANGVVLEALEDSVVDGIKTLRVVECFDAKKMYKVPFRRFPVASVSQGVAPLIWNLDSMIHRGSKTGDKTAKDLIVRFGLDTKLDYGLLGRLGLLGPEWIKSRMLEKPEWQQELEEVAARFN